MARAIAAHGVLPAVRAFQVGSADDAGIKLNELTFSTCPAAAPKTRIQYRAIGVDVARLDTTFAFAAFMTRQAVNDRRYADPVDTHVGDAGIIMLASAVTVGLTRGEAAALSANFALRAAT